MLRPHIQRRISLQPTKITTQYLNTRCPVVSCFEIAKKNFMTVTRDTALMNDTSEMHSVTVVIFVCALDLVPH